MIASLVNAGGTNSTLTRRRRSCPSPPPTEPNTGSSVPSKSTVRAGLAGVHPADDVRPGRQHPPGVLGALGAGHALHDDLADARSERSPSVRLPCQRCASSAALSAPSSMVCACVTSGCVGLVQDPPALVDVVAVQPHHQRLGRLVTEHLQRPTMPFATASQAVIPPNTLTNTLLHVRVVQDDVQPVGHHLRARAAADVQEVRRLHPAVRLPGVGDHVQGGHHQAGAVADDPDLPVRA